jgi:hypothetical protein
MEMPPSTGLDEPIIAGPFHLFGGSFVVEFLKPHPSRNATCVAPPSPHSVTIANRMR